MPADLRVADLRANRTITLSFTLSAPQPFGCSVRGGDATVAHFWFAANVRGADLHDADALLRRAQARAAVTIIAVRAVRRIGRALADIIVAADRRGSEQGHRLVIIHEPGGHGLSRPDVIELRARLIPVQPPGHGHTAPSRQRVRA